MLGMPQSGLRLIFAMATAAISISIATPVQAQDLDQAPVTAAPLQGAKLTLKVSDELYVSAGRLNLRSQPSLSADSVIGVLEQNDKVQILDLLDGSTALVKIKILESQDRSLNTGADYYVSADYLSANPVAISAASDNTPSKYFVVQNIATEKMRIYERCTATPDCPHRLVMETDIVAGRPEGDKATKDQTAFVTWLGRYKIADWVKFYQDVGERYPSWYDPTYPDLPKPGASPSSWLSKKYLPNKETGEMRGAFGWYAAMVGPNSNSQWIHGTIGWGSDGDKFINYTRNLFVNLVADPRSHGCTRLENRAVAYARHLLPIGTELLRVYAVEAYRDESRSAYASQAQPLPWNFILTKENVRGSNGVDSDAQMTMARNIDSRLILEQGSYQVDQYPNGVPFKDGAGWISRIKGKSGNTYNIEDNEFSGVFLIDEGRFIGYHHPASLPVGGFTNREIPAGLQTSGSYQLVTKKNR